MERMTKTIKLRGLELGDWRVELASGGPISFMRATAAPVNSANPNVYMRVSWLSASQKGDKREIMVA